MTNGDKYSFAEKMAINAFNELKKQLLVSTFDEMREMATIISDISCLIDKPSGEALTDSILEFSYTLPYERLDIARAIKLELIIKADSLEEAKENITKRHKLGLGLRKEIRP